MRKLLSVTSKCVSSNVKTHLLGKDTQKMDARKSVHNSGITSKCVFANVKSHLLGRERKMARPKKRQCRNRQLLAAEWSIFAGVVVVTFLRDNVKTGNLWLKIELPSAWANNGNFHENLKIPKNLSILRHYAKFKSSHKPPRFRGIFLAIDRSVDFCAR